MRNSITGLRCADHLKDAEFQVEVIPNQGSGAAAMRNKLCGATTEAGRDALGYRHERKKAEGSCLGLITIGQAMPQRPWG
jgi:hypothetical protein